MDFMTYAQAMGIGRGILAVGTGIGAGIATVLGQIPAIQASPHQLDNLTTAIGGGAIAIVIYGSIQILTVVIKPIITDRTSYWEDKKQMRDFEERKLKLQYESEERKQKMLYTLQRNNWNTREMYDWMVRAKAQNPSLPKPPEWIEMHDATGERESQ